MKNQIIEAFRHYKELGLDPLPIPYQDGHPTKGPKITGWQQTAENQGFTESDFYEPCNIGVLLGGQKNLTDIDCDNTWAVKAAKWMLHDTDTFMVFGRAGKPESHYVFFTDESCKSFKINHPISKECVIEYRCVKTDGARGNQTVFPPSIWCNKTDTSDQQPITETRSNPESAPFSASRLGITTKAIAAVALMAEYFPIDGQRHDTHLALAGWFARGGVKLDKAKFLIGSAYAISEGFNHDLSKAESVVASVYKTHSGAPNPHLYGYTKLKGIGYPVAVLDCVADLLGVEKPESTDRKYTLTDTGNGLRFVDSFGADFKYVIETQKWMTFDGSVWVSDDRLVRRERAKQIGAVIHDEANKIKVLDEDEDTANKKLKTALMTHAKYTASAHGVDALLKMASSDPRIVVSVAEFDTYSELLNVSNGVVNLRSGELIKHDRSLLMTQKAPTAYKPSAKSEVFTTALETWTKNHSDLPDYMRRLYGYSITGTKHEEKIIVMKGLGGTGKGTFNVLLQETIGRDYVRTADSKTFLDSKRPAGAASSDIARLEGARIVICSEFEKGARLAQAFLKSLSGGDTQAARGLFQPEREFKSKAQLFFQTNYRPVIDSTDTGNRRRYVELPFDNQMIQDTRLKDRLLQSAEVREAFLAWMVQGAVEYFREGLGTCATVEEATACLFADNDELSGFFLDYLVVDGDGKITKQELLLLYIKWCDTERSKCMTDKELFKAMRERGYMDTRWRDGEQSPRGFKGIREKTDYDMYESRPQIFTDKRPKTVLDDALLFEQAATKYPEKPTPEHFLTRSRPIQPTKYALVM